MIHSGHMAICSNEWFVTITTVVSEGRIAFTVIWFELFEGRQQSPPYQGYAPVRLSFEEAESDEQRVADAFARRSIGPSDGVAVRHLLGGS